MSRRRRSEAGHLQILCALIGTAITAAIPPGCGQSGDLAQDAGAAEDAAARRGDGAGPTADSGRSSSGGEAGSSSSSGMGSSSSSCDPNLTVTNFMVDPTRCEPQLKSETASGTLVCSWTIEQPCSGDAGSPDGGAADGGACAVCDEVFDGGIGGNDCFGGPVPDGGHITHCGTCCVAGRAPRGFRPARAPGRNARAARLADMAQLEAASVEAFHALHADLARLGAPRRLLSSVIEAAGDEVRHARAVGGAAERFGARVPRTRVAAIDARSAEQLAIENAEEGCVRETFGAALAAVQADRATDAGIRRMMRVIAREELAHAALAWDVARWLDRRLDAAARARVHRARRSALARLDAEIRCDAGRSGDAILGLPDARSTRALLERLRLPLERGLA